MLQMTPRIPVLPGRFPPVPYLTGPPRLSAADRRIIKMALGAGSMGLPTDVPDLSPLLDFIQAVEHGEMPPIAFGPKRRESAA